MFSVQRLQMLSWDWPAHRVHSPGPRCHSSDYTAFLHTALGRCSRESQPPADSVKERITRSSMQRIWTYVKWSYTSKPMVSQPTVYALLLLTRILEIPKSPILTIIWCLSSRIFCVFRSLCRMSLLWTWYKASRIWTKKWRMVSSSSRELHRFCM